MKIRQLIIYITLIITHHTMAYADSKPSDVNVSTLATLIKQALKVKDSNTLHNNKHPERNERHYK